MFMLNLLILFVGWSTCCYLRIYCASGFWVSACLRVLFWIFGCFLVGGTLSLFYLLFYCLFGVDFVDLVASRWYDGVVALYFFL